MPNLASGAATFDVATARVEYLPKLIKTVATRCPLVTNYMDTMTKGGSRLEFFDQALPTGNVQLNGAYTSGSGTITIDAPTASNPYTIIPGVTQFATRTSVPLVWVVTAYNSGTYTATVSVVSGTDTNVADNTVLDLQRSTPIGSPFANISDVHYATSDYNYIENYNFELAIDNLHSAGRFVSATENELTFANQLQNNMSMIAKILEKKFLRGARSAGTGGVTQNGNTVQAGNGSTMGGILQAMAARGGITNTDATPISEDFLESIMIQLDNNGAFNNIDERVKTYGIDMVDAYCSPSQLGSLNKLTRLQRAPDAFYGENEKTGGTAGTWNHKIIAYGKLITFQVSDAMTNSEILFVPKGKSLLSLKVMRFAEEQPELNIGDAKRRLYATTATASVTNPWCLAYANSLTTL